MKVNLEVNDDLIKDLIITALEGGSNYWYDLDKEDLNKVKAHYHPEVRCNKPFAEMIAEKVIENKIKIAIYDVESEDEPEKLGILSFESIKTGLRLMLTHSPIQFGDIFSETYDVYTADTLLQYAVMGKIVYG